jgi:hypothetical protein
MQILGQINDISLGAHKRSMAVNAGLMGFVTGS